MEPHHSRPDASNLHKAFEDALLAQDMIVYDYRVSKFWFNHTAGFIEVVMPANPVYMIRGEDGQGVSVHPKDPQRFQQDPIIR